MIETILPSVVAVVEARDDAGERPLLDEEEALVGRAVEKRREEFATGRACARAALARLGHAPAPILSGKRGEPLWPSGVVGSITHCDGYRGAAVAPSSELRSIGIDAEPHAPLPQGLLGDIALEEELPHLVELSRLDPSMHWDRLLFSAKESVYKAWFPLARRWLGFEDARLRLDPSSGKFEARLLIAGPVIDGREVNRFGGAWLVRDGLVLTAIAVAR
jgi:enterobactin synthetase component D / holo-[acyl-carrier protein] synthase